MPLARRSACLALAVVNARWGIHHANAGAACSTYHGQGAHEILGISEPPTALLATLSHGGPESVAHSSLSRECSPRRPARLPPCLKASLHFDSRTFSAGSCQKKTLTEREFLASRSFARTEASHPWTSRFVSKVPSLKAENVTARLGFQFSAVGWYAGLDGQRRCPLQTDEDIVGRLRFFSVFRVGIP